MNRIEYELSEKVIDRIYHQGIEKYNEITDRLSKKWDEIGRPTNIDDYIPNGVEISLEEAAYHLRNGYIDAADSALKRCDA